MLLDIRACNCREEEEEEKEGGGGRGERGGA